MRFEVYLLTGGRQDRMGDYATVEEARKAFAQSALPGQQCHIGAVERRGDTPMLLWTGRVGQDGKVIWSSLSGVGAAARTARG